ncbi:unnamed protein product [Diamesa hyperborea]
METGYINEGGQLKAKSGQKYVINQYKTAEGFYVTQICGYLYFVALIVMIILTALITYFLIVPSCSKELHFNGNESIHTGSFVKPLGSHPAEDHGTNDAVLSDQAIITKNSDVPIVEDEIEFHDGWIPSHYDLLLEPNIETFTSNGSVNIWITRDLNVKNMKPIVLDIKDIEISSCNVFKVDRTDNEENLVPDCQYGKNNESYVITLKKTKYPLTNITIQLSFVSQLTSTLQGFYRGSYYDEQKKNNTWFVSTQFSPIDARRAFPCFDNPGKKATFKISLIRPIEKEVSISNMPLENSIPERDGYVRENFLESPRMSTYLLAFHVSDLKVALTSDVKNKSLPLIKTYTRNEYKDMTNFGFKLTAAGLPFFESYFGIQFRLPKIDIVAVPDFGFNAMENWGLITFRESALLVPENTNRSSSVDHMQRVANTLLHEIAHQWFGNLVTMKWYDDLWLKEGFSTYLSYVACNEIKPEWNYFSTLTTSEMQKAMSKDSDSLSHPISFPVKTKSDIRRIFDPISYSKGALIINMMRGYLGESTFRSGLKSYLKKFEYGNALQDDLWEVMTEQAHTDEVLQKNLTIKQIMDTWTLQAGYPVVTVTRNETNIIFSQQQYLLPENNVNDTTKWFIPISLATKDRQPNNEIPDYWLTNENREMVIDKIVDDSEWIYLNINRTGYYRVNYDTVSWTNLMKNFIKLPEIARAQLIDDSFQLARAGLVGYDIPITFSIVIATQTPLDYLSWWSFAHGIDYLSNMVSREPAYESYRTVMRAVIAYAYDKIGFEELPNETELELLHRARIVGLACEFGLDRCTNTAQVLYREWFTDKFENKIPPNLKATVYCTSLREGGVLEWNFAFKQYQETTSASEKEMILTALGCTLKPWLLTKYLNLVISPDSGVRKQDGARAFSSVAKNIVGNEIAFDFLYTNIAEIFEYFGDGFNTVSKMIDSVTTFMNKDYHREQFKKFAEKANKLGLITVEKSIKLSEIEIQKNIFWHDNLYSQFQKYLDKVIIDLDILSD